MQKKIGAISAAVAAVPSAPHSVAWTGAGAGAAKSADEPRSAGLCCPRGVARSPAGVSPAFVVADC
jgi:hypothetical protein